MLFLCIQKGEKRGDGVEPVRFYVATAVKSKKGRRYPNYKRVDLSMLYNV